MVPETCPNCGADVPRGAKSCPECGADEETGWSDSATADRLGIPDDNFDYERFVKEEFGPARVKPKGIHWLWWATALILLVALVWFLLR
jgi:RNA polymerase subunit RPABC4/transcription elongation factor Spt4